jgi:hypothetical protein
VNWRFTVAGAAAWMGRVDVVRVELKEQASSVLPSRNWPQPVVTSLPQRAWSSAM